MAQAKALRDGLSGEPITTPLGLQKAHVVKDGANLSRADAVSLTEFGHGDPVSEGDLDQVPCGAIQGFLGVEH